MYVAAGNIDRVWRRNCRQIEVSAARKPTSWDIAKWPMESTFIDPLLVGRDKSDHVQGTVTDGGHLGLS